MSERETLPPEIQALFKKVREERFASDSIKQQVFEDVVRQAAPPAVADTLLSDSETTATPPTGWLRRKKASLGIATVGLSLGVALGAGGYAMIADYRDKMISAPAAAAPPGVSIETSSTASASAAPTLSSPPANSSRKTTP